MVNADVSRQADDEQDRDELNLIGILRMLWAGRWKILMVMVFFVAIAWFQASQKQPQYEATTKVLFDLQERNVVNIDEVVGARNYNGSDLQNQVEILRSTALIERVIDELNLQNDPYFNPALRPPQPSRFDWFTLPPELRGTLESIGLLSPPAPTDAVIDQRRQRLEIIAQVKGGLRLQPIRNATVIQISYVATNPRIAAKLANTIAEQYIIDQLEGKLEATRSATEWLSERVLQLQEQVETSEAEMAKVEARLVRASGQTVEITRAQLTSLNTELGLIQAREITLATQVDRLRVALENRTDIGSIPEFRESRLISEYRTQESDLLSQEVALRARVGDQHPSYLRLQAQLQDIRSKMRVEAERVVESVVAQLNAAREEATQLRARVTELEEKALAQSQDEIALRQLERKVNASRLLYENFLGRLQETSQQDSLQTSDARVISPAEIPDSPLTAGKKRALMVAAIAGLVVGALLVKFLDMLNNTLRGPEQVEQETGLSVLGSIPAIDKEGTSRRELISYFREKPNSALAEAVRNLRTSLLFSDFDNQPKVVMITSSVPKEGKSSLSMLLALTSQNMGRKTIIVDCDFRLPALSTLVDVDHDKPGILSFMNGEASFEEALSRDEETGLDILMARRKEAKTLLNPADVLSSKTFETFVKDLRDKYDLVILDTPPVLAVSDPRIVSKTVDKVLYMVRWDSTERGPLVQGVKSLRAVKAPIAGAVLTQVNEAKAAQYAYDGYGYYGKSYGEYYTE